MCGKWGALEQRIEKFVRKLSRLRINYRFGGFLARIRNMSVLFLLIKMDINDKKLV